MSELIHERSFDSTLDFLREGNLFVFNRCREYSTNIFMCRLMFKKTVCVSGASAAKMFYEKGRMTRRGAIPESVLRLLQDKGSVATLDDEDHRQRKRLFLFILEPTQICKLQRTVLHNWEFATERWQHTPAIDLLKEVTLLLGRSVIGWSGLPVNDNELTRRTRQIRLMIENAGTFGPKNWYASWLRRGTENWLRRIIEHSHPRSGGNETPLDLLLNYRENGNHLARSLIVVELLNILRPVIAVAWFVRLAVIALHQFPECKHKLQNNDDDYLDCFVQEVRRFYPFFPFIGGISRAAFQWQGHEFAANTRFLLDVYGTNRAPDTWRDPERFWPERFLGRQSTPYDFIPQGGGDYQIHHRCPGEDTTIALLKLILKLMSTTIDFEVVSGDYRLNLSRMPATPYSTVVLSGIKRRV